MPDSPDQLIQGLLAVVGEQDRCLDDEDLDRFLELAQRRDDLQNQLIQWETVPDCLHPALHQIFHEGERLMGRLAEMDKRWRAQETDGHRQAQGLKQYVAEGQTPMDPHFLDRRK